MTKNLDLKIIAVVVFVALIGIVLNQYVQPLLNGTNWKFFPIAQLLLIPSMYFLISESDLVLKYSPIKRLLLITAAVIIWTPISNYFDIDRIWGKELASLLSALLTYIVIAISQKKR